jgi:hypothetical protein
MPEGYSESEELNNKRCITNSNVYAKDVKDFVFGWLVIFG